MSLVRNHPALKGGLLAWRWYGETLDKRVTTAVLLMLLGGAVLVLEQGAAGQMQLLGLLAVMLATRAWGGQHAHAHTHDELAHEHAHSHDDGHHDHTHEGVHDAKPTGPHSHWHRHERLTHAHAHVPDAHHGHTH